MNRYFDPTTKIPFEKIIVFENGELKNNQDIKVKYEIEREEPASVYSRDIDLNNLTIKFEEKTTI